MEPVPTSDQEWKEALTPEEYQVLREKGTEPPFSGAYVAEHRDGSYRCKGCGSLLFASGTKFDSGSGWPSFTDPAVHAHVGTREDRSNGMDRTEVYCKVCDGHLGHVFDDGPPEAGGKRYCINSKALSFEEEDPSPNL